MSIVTNVEQSFERSIGALEQIFAFTEGFLSAQRIDDGHRYAVNFALEELFTNMVKYSLETDSKITIALEHENGKLTIRLTDFDVEPFDVTQAQEVDINRPIEEREPGGLGLHLIRKLVDEIDYRYADRKSTITLTKKLETGS